MLMYDSYLECTLKKNITVVKICIKCIWLIYTFFITIINYYITYIYLLLKLLHLQKYVFVLNMFLFLFFTIINYNLTYIFLSLFHFYFQWFITEHRTCIFDIIYYHYHIILSSSLLLFNLFLSVNCIQHVFNSFYILIFKRLVTENKKSFLMNVKYTYPISIVSC